MPDSGSKPTADTSRSRLRMAGPDRADLHAFRRRVVEDDRVRHDQFAIVLRPDQHLAGFVEQAEPRLRRPVIPAVSNS